MGTVGSGRGRVVGFGRFRELGSAAVGGESHCNLNGAGIIDTGGTGRVGQVAGLVTAGWQVTLQRAVGSTERGVGSGGHDISRGGWVGSRMGTTGWAIMN